MLPLSIVVLAAGQGTRMRSTLPKVLHPLAGKPLLQHVIDTARQLLPQRILIVYGHGGAEVRRRMNASDLHWVEQAQQLGTGHAMAQTLPELADESVSLVLYGDVPLIQHTTLRPLVASAQAGKLALLTVNLTDPRGYGRIVRDAQAAVQCIVEEKDASAEQKRITEVNTGILAAHSDKLRQWLAQLNSNNAQGEYYLTDIIAMAVQQGIAVQTSQPQTATEVLGVNSRGQLAELERVYQRQQAEQFMAQGVSFRDPARVDFRGEVSFGRDVEVDINCIFSGKVTIGDNVRIGAGSIISNSQIESGVEILPLCVIEDTHIGSHSRVGPYSRLRPGAVLKGDNHIGNFVEIKNSEIGLGSKVNHLSYVGDTQMGGKVNIGAGTITANYDGANKHRTIIQDHASTGSNTVLVAPVTVGKGATIGAGSVITKQAPAEKLTLTRAKQITVEGWQRPSKKTRD
ncbi:MAG: bifunctional UDP-N-acetylglucosamine diphosphorylase/glucosamine-1-phosphate N-acetyltransferase GlmU [Gammaproteobacteria bacterium]|nr:bifunctional UDP-N-acetylglucosamine diphosphorylase/glucosamine-1-phosphate N-acetyltransferase GlmU [Gammaproteobacteria bacterium]